MVDNSFFEYCSRENEKLLNEWDYSQNQNTPEEYSKCSGKKYFGNVRMDIHGLHVLVTE